MKLANNIEKLIRHSRVLNVDTKIEMDQRILGDALAAYEKSVRTKSALVKPNVYAAIMKSKIVRLTAAVLIITVVLWVISFWPSGSSTNGKWWLGPPTAWGQEIIASLEGVQALVYRDRHAQVSDYGPTEFGRGWQRFYIAKNKRRRDRYDDGINITNTQWIVPDGEGLLLVEVSFEYECYFTKKVQTCDFLPARMEWMCSLVRLLGKADRHLGITILEGRECVGFEIAGSKRSDNTHRRFERIWLDIETKLPVRIERHRIPSSFDANRTLISIYDQFEYYRHVAADMFEPDIPEGFINAHPDEVQEARDRETKGEMVFADVPEGLIDEIVAALRDVETCVYVETGVPPHREDARYVYLSKNAWRIDHYSGEQLQTTEWFIIQQDMDASLLELEDKAKAYVVAKWECNYDSNTVRVIGHTVESGWHHHPMSHILFLAGFCDRADRFIDSTVIDGVKCFGFEISAKKYGDNPDTTIVRLWFDVETKLPVSIELEYVMDDRLETRVKDQFEWNLGLPADTFVPQVPEGFMLRGSEDNR